MRTLVAALALLGLALAPQQSAAQRAGAGAAAHVYFLRGFMGLSPGLEEIAAELRRRGVPATVHAHVEWRSIAEEALRARRSGQAQTIVLVGHSLGAGAAFQAAEHLRQSHVPVRLIVALDAVERLQKPSNVQRVLNLYFPAGMGTPVDAARGVRGAVENVTLSANVPYNHFSMGTAPEIQRRVLTQVLGAVGGKGKRRTAR